MPTRLLDQLDVINIVEGYISGPASLHNSGVLVNNGFGDFELTGNGSDTLRSYYAGEYQKTGSINYTSFPAIPPDSLITKISIKFGLLLNAVLTASGFNNRCDYQLLVSGGFVGGTEQEFGILEVPLGASLNSFSNSQSQSSIFRDLILSYPVSYLDLLTYYTDIKFLLSAYVDTNSPALAGTTTDFTIQISDFQIEITYTSGPFSWYLETHEETIDGQPATVVDDAVQVPDGDVPPAGSIFYGTSSDYPSSIPYYDYYYPPTGDIINQPIPPGPAWLLQFVSFNGDLRFDFATQSTTVALIDPSGIYTLIEGKTHDTLYERTTIDHQDVKIPDPFGKTGYVP